MVAARAYVAKAWHHRGGAWAYKVTPEAWRLFGENLKKAVEHYEEAMKLHPDYPEAAADMIVIAMTGEGNQTPQQWFEKAVAAQIDYMPAYDKLRCALWPRWTGSHEAMYAFGCRCADTRRYDTLVPFVLLQVVQDIDRELGFNGEVWRRKGVYSRVKEVLEGMADDPARTDGLGVHPSRSGVKSVHVALAERSGNYQDARRLLDELGDRFDRTLFDSWCSHPEYMLGSIYAYSGKGERIWKEHGT